MKIWQTGSGLGLLRSICMASKYSEHFGIINPNIMRSILAWASLAFVVTLAAAQSNCGPKPACDCNANQPQVVTYGEPCYCKESFPYSIQVPESVPEPVETLKSYGYSVDALPCPCESHLQLPVKIQTPIAKHHTRDYLSGRSYGVTVECQPKSYVPRSYSFDFDVQKPVPVQKVYKPKMSFEVQHFAERVNPRFAPLPIAVQTPMQTEVRETRLTGLTSKVDRILVPACECGGCPECKDVSTRCPQKPKSSCW